MFNLFNKRKEKIPDRTLEEIRGVCKILFIDDRNFPVVDIIKNAGWINTKRIKDAEAIEQTDIREAHIIFCDIQGVGKKLKFKDEGLGLVIALKNSYPNKKVIVYSGEDQGRVEAFHKGLDVADGRLSKLADPYQFQLLVEKYSKEAFSLSECIDRIKGAILHEFGTSVDTKAIHKQLSKLYKKNDFSEESISKVFNLDNASTIASIIKLFFNP